MEEERSQTFLSIVEAMQGLSIVDKLFSEDANPIDPYDDLIFNFEMNDSENYANDDHELNLQNEHMYVEDLMDQGLDELI